MQRTVLALVALLVVVALGALFFSEWHGSLQGERQAQSSQEATQPRGAGPALSGQVAERAAAERGQETAPPEERPPEEGPAEEAPKTRKGRVIVVDENGHEHATLSGDLWVRRSADAKHEEAWWSAQVRDGTFTVVQRAGAELQFEAFDSPMGVATISRESSASEDKEFDLLLRGQLYPEMLVHVIDAQSGEALSDITVVRRDVRPGNASSFTGLYPAASNTDRVQGLTSPLRLFPSQSQFYELDQPVYFIRAPGYEWRRIMPQRSSPVRVRTIGLKASAGSLSLKPTNRSETSAWHVDLLRQRPESASGFWEELSYAAVPSSTDPIVFEGLRPGRYGVRVSRREHGKLLASTLIEVTVRRGERTHTTFEYPDDELGSKGWKGTVRLPDGGWRALSWESGIVEVRATPIDQAGSLEFADAETTAVSTGVPVEGREGMFAFDLGPTPLVRHEITVSLLRPGPGETGRMEFEFTVERVDTTQELELKIPELVPLEVKFEPTDGVAMDIMERLTFGTVTWQVQSSRGGWSAHGREQGGSSGASAVELRVPRGEVTVTISRTRRHPETLALFYRPHLAPRLKSAGRSVLVHPARVSVQRRGAQALLRVFLARRVRVVMSDAERRGLRPQEVRSDRGESMGFVGSLDAEGQSIWIASPGAVTVRFRGRPGRPDRFASVALNREEYVVETTLDR